MVSEIVATLKDDINPMQMLLSALPGGSITGAPKIRAMQIIEELEESARGAYCGTLGYFNFDGTGRWNILIRSFNNIRISFLYGQVVVLRLHQMQKQNIKKVLIKSLLC